MGPDAARAPRPHPAPLETLAAVAARAAAGPTRRPAQLPRAVAAAARSHAREPARPAHATAGRTATAAQALARNDAGRAAQMVASRRAGPGSTAVAGCNGRAGTPVLTVERSGFSRNYAGTSPSRAMHVFASNSSSQSSLSSPSLPSISARKL